MILIMIVILIFIIKGEYDINLFTTKCYYYYCHNRQRLCKHMSSIPVFKNNTKVDNKYKIFYENTPEVK